MGGKAHLLFRYWLLVCLSLSLVLPGIALGQDEEEDLEFMLEDIVVTAEKREVELQRTPMEIDVVRPQEMRMYNINRIYDLEKVIPDLSVYTAAGTYNLVSIREVQTTLVNPIYETTVSTHIDGINLTKVVGLDNFFYDLERVEVLKGPQGTLYGRGSTAGMMNMITRKPILGDFGGNASIEVGNYGRLRGDWALNFPLGEKMAMRLAGRRYLSDGFSDVGYGDSDSQSHRLSWRYEPNDLIIINMMIDYIELDDNGSVTGGPFNAEGYYFDTYGDGVEIVAAPPAALLDLHYQSGGPVHSRFFANWALQNATDQNNVHNEIYGIQGSASYAGEVATATIEWGHRTTHEEKPFVWGGARLSPGPYSGPPPFWPSPIDQVYVSVTTPSQFYNAKAHGNTNSVELRFTSNKTIASGDKVEWILGAMGQKDMTRQRIDFGEGGPDDFWYDVQVKTNTEAVFAQGSWMPIEKWNFTAGLRWNADAKYYYGNYSDRANPDYEYYNNQAEWSEITYRTNISYFPTDDIMPYLSYSKGYRTGQFDYRATPVPEELVDAWELGIKSRFLDNKLQINAAYYFYDYENYSNATNISKCWEDADGDHVCDDVAGNPADMNDEGEYYTEYDPDMDPADRITDGTLDNWDNEYGMYTGYAAGSAEQKGLSLSIQYLPTMDDRLSLSATWRNNKYVSPYDARLALLTMFPDADSPYRDYSENADLGGYEFGGAPIRGNMSYSHTFRFGSGDTLMARGTAFYEGQGIDQILYRTFPEEHAMPGRDAYWTFDASLVYNSTRWMSPGNLWSLRFSIQNMFDSDALRTRTFSPYWFNRNYPYPDGAGTVSGAYISPRTYSITFDINF